MLDQTNIFDQDGTVGFNESIQGSGGTCYLMSSMASMGEYPDLVRNLFLTQEKNSANAVAVRFYIRGKPWVVSIDH